MSPNEEARASDVGSTPPNGAKPVWNELGQVAGHGFTLAASTGLFMAAGWWLDGKLGTVPLLAILGALTGAAAGLYSMYHHLVVAPRLRAAERTRVGADGGSGEGRER